jgi:FdhD protein
MRDQPSAASAVDVTVRRWHEGNEYSVLDRVAEEVPVAITYQGVPHVVMLATPQDLEELAVGFTLSEGIVAHKDEIRSVESAIQADGSCEIRIGVDGERFSQLLRRQRNLAGRTGCGLCGSETIEAAIRNPLAVGGGVRITSDELHACLKDIERRQPINAQTGSVHAAAWAVPGAGILQVREDVGRHNALDKVIGAVLRSGQDVATGYFIITSRASYEMVQKTVTLGASLLAAVSAPTAFAVRLAERTRLTLIGFARERQHVVYTHPDRLV